MPKVSRKPGGRGVGHGAVRAAGATLTTAFMKDAGAVMPEGAAGFTFHASRGAVEVFSDQPAKVKPLLMGYSSALGRSRAAGRPVSFQVEVDPSGDATVSPLEAVPMAAVASPAGIADVPDTNLHAALDEARSRGRIAAAEILAGEDMLSADQFAAFLGTSRMTVNTKRRNNQVLGLDGAKRGFRFPIWQVGDDGKPFEVLPSLFERLGSSPWGVYRFLVRIHPELDGLTGREALQRGKANELLEIAEGIAQGTFA